MEHTENIIHQKQGLITSLLKVFDVLELRLIDYRDKVEAISVRCINFKKETGLYLRTSTLEEMTTKVVLNEILHHVDMQWIIRSNKLMKYEIDESNNQDWLTKGPWYNKSICSRLHGSLFGYFITHSITDRYNLMCSLVSHDKKN